MTGVVGPNEVAARAKLTQLTQEHRDLDTAIDAAYSEGLEWIRNYG